MRVIVTTVAPDLDAAMEPLFWRAPYLLVVDTDTMQWQALETPGAPNVHAAGTRAGLLACRQHADAVVSGDFGPNSFVVLDSAGIPRYLFEPPATGRQAVERLCAGQFH